MHFGSLSYQHPTCIKWFSLPKCAIGSYRQVLIQAHHLTHATKNLQAKSIAWYSAVQ